MGELLTYSQMCLRDTFMGRFRYLKLDTSIGVATFGFDRHLNQAFYMSRAWKDVRDEVIIRDQGCDLGHPGHDIRDKILVHHMNPIKPQDILEFNEDILDPEYLICVSMNTHNAIHFSDESRLETVIERTPGDTKLW